MKEDRKFYSFNVIDIVIQRVYIESQRTKANQSVDQSLLHSWKASGLPDFLLLDYELTFRGSNRYPRSPGLVLRLCLHFGVKPLFINGIWP
jgi:hypothetical protein